MEWIIIKKGMKLILYYDDFFLKFLEYLWGIFIYVNRLYMVCVVNEKWKFFWIYIVVYENVWSGIN